jgi:hypothetical protein
LNSQEAGGDARERMAPEIEREANGLHHFIAVFDFLKAVYFAPWPPAVNSPGCTGELQLQSDRTPMMKTAQTSLLAFGSSVAFGGRFSILPAREILNAPR